MRLRTALAAAILVALATQPARAQSYEDRGYGGPLSVGPNFQKGGQHSTTDYGAKPAKKPAAKYSAPDKSPAKVAKPKKPRVKTDEIARKPPATEPPASTETPVANKTTEPDTTAGATPAADAGQTCRKFDATTSTTIEVPCE